MDIQPITNTNELPKRYRYRTYKGNLLDCEAEHARKYPHYQGVTAFWYDAAKYLYVPMDWNREGEDAKAR